MSMFGEDLYGSSLYGGGSESEDGSSGSAIYMSGSVEDTVAHGPSYISNLGGMPIAEDGLPVEPLALQLVTFNDLSSVITTFNKSFDRSFNDVYNDTGSAAFAVDNTDPDVGSLELERLVNFKVYGNIAFTMLIESLHRVASHEGEEHDQITVASGRGHFAVWEQAVLYPSRGVNSLPIEEDLVFNWTSLDYNDLGWGYAKEIARQDQTTGIAWGFDWLLGLQDPQNWSEIPGDVEAFWIWDHSGTQSWAKPGTCYFRKYFWVPAGVTQIAIYYAMDNAGKIFIDGIPQAEQATQHVNFATSYVTLDVTPGPHLIAIEATNEPLPGSSSMPAPPTPVTHTVVSGDTLWAIARSFYGDGRQWRQIYDANQAMIQAAAEFAGLWNPYDPGHWIFPGQVLTIPGINQPSSNVQNPGGVIASIYTYTADGPTELLCHTDGTWKMVGYPGHPPGMTPGHVIHTVKQKAKDRGSALGSWNLMFTSAVDSAGNPWPVVADIASKVGTNYLTFLQELCVTYIDVWAAPGTKDLYAWNKGTRGSVRAIDLHAPTDTTDPTTGNMYSLSNTIIT